MAHQNIHDGQGLNGAGMAVGPILERLSGQVIIRKFPKNDGAEKGEKKPGRNETDKGGIVYLCGVRPGLFVLGGRSRGRQRVHFCLANPARPYYVFIRRPCQGKNGRIDNHVTRPRQDPWLPMVVPASPAHP